MWRLIVTRKYRDALFGSTIKLLMQNINAVVLNRLFLNNHFYIIAGAVCLSIRLSVSLYPNIKLECIWCRYYNNAFVECLHYIIYLLTQYFVVGVCPTTAQASKIIGNNTSILLLCSRKKHVPNITGTINYCR